MMVNQKLNWRGGALTCFLLTALLAALALPTGLRAQDIDQERLEFLKRTTIDVMKKDFRAEAKLQLAEMKAFLDLDDKTIKRAQIYLKGISAKSLDNAIERVESNMDLRREKLFRTEPEAFRVNGKLFWFEDGDEEAIDTPLKIFADVVLNRLKMEHSRGSSSTGLSGRTVGIENMDFWPSALKSVSKKNRESYLEHVLARRKKEVVNGMAVIVRSELDLNDEQFEKMHALIEKHYKPMIGYQALQEIEYLFRNQKLMDEKPEFLDEIQQLQWGIMKSRAQMGLR